MRTELLTAPLRRIARRVRPHLRVAGSSRVVAVVAWLSVGLPSHAERARIPLDELRTFAEVMEQVRTAYVEPVDDRTLLENAIKGMLSELDPYSAYLDKKAFAELREQTTGQIAGVGIDLGIDHGRIAVITPIDDSPAARAGVQPGDLVISIDRVPTKGMLLSDAIDRLRGPAGSVVTLELQGEGVPRRSLRITRAIVSVTSVRSAVPEAGVGYLRISQFQTDTARHVLAALNRLRVQNGGRLRGVVVDLRNNPGGVVKASVDVADAFLESGAIVSARGRIDGAQFAFSATRGDAIQGAPVIVLINEGTASAAEIVAGALQDQRRATLIGARTFGKGSVQTVLTLSGERAIKLTTALYYTPSGRSIQNAGIAPDIVVAGNRSSTFADGSGLFAAGRPVPARYAGADTQLAAGLQQLRSGATAPPPQRPAARPTPPRAAGLNR